MNVQIFIPCFIDQLYPSVAFNMIKVLQKAGCTVEYNLIKPVADNQHLMQVSGENQKKFALNS